MFVTPFPYWHQMGLPASTTTEELVRQALYQLELVLQQQTAPDDTAAIIIEPVLGEGGYVPAPPSYLKGLREIADKHKILLVFDEVQCGFGRTGKMFFSEYSGVVPDVMVVAKGIANGFPLSGIVSRKEIMDVQAPGSIVSFMYMGVCGVRTERLRLAVREGRMLVTPLRALLRQPSQTSSRRRRSSTTSRLGESSSSCESPSALNPSLGPRNSSPPLKSCAKTPKLGVTSLTCAVSG